MSGWWCSALPVVAGRHWAGVVDVCAAPEMPARVASAIGPLYKLSLNKFYFDEIY